MKVEVSNGEIVDKISILLIKMEKMKDSNKINNVDKELKQLLPYLDEIGINVEDELFKKLKKMNLKLWDIEDKLRKLESQKKFNGEFIELARQVYYTNDLRAIIKKEININTGSELIEEKSYEDYK
jgi:protein subunit release factor A